MGWVGFPVLGSSRCIHEGDDDLSLDQTYAGRNMDGLGLMLFLVPHTMAVFERTC